MARMSWRAAKVRRDRVGFEFNRGGIMPAKRKRRREYEDFLNDNEELNEGYEDLDLDYLDSDVTEDQWHRNFVCTGSIDIDPDWF